MSKYLSSIFLLIISTVSAGAPVINAIDGTCNFALTDATETEALDCRITDNGSSVWGFYYNTYNPKPSEVTNPNNYPCFFIDTDGTIYWTNNVINVVNPLKYVNQTMFVVSCVNLQPVPGQPE